MYTNTYSTFCNCIVATAMAVVAFSCSPARKNIDDNKSYVLLEKVVELNAGGNKQAAVVLADSALAMNPADTTRCWLLCEKTVALTDMGKMAKAIAIGKEAMALAKRNNDVDAQLNMRGALGIAYRRMGKIDSAIVEYKKGIELAVKEKNSEYEIYLDNCAAVLFSENNRFGEALEYSRRAEKTALAAKDTVEWLSARANVGGVYLRMKRYKDVVRIMTPMWNNVLHVGYNVLTLKYLSHLLMAHNELNNYDKLNYYMHYAEKTVNGVSPTSNGVLGILEIKAAILGKQKCYFQQLSLLDSIAAANKNNHAMPESRLLFSKATCFWNMGRKNEAYRALTQAYQKLDSVKKSDVEKSLSEFTAKYKTLEKEMKIEQMSRREAEQQNRILWLAIAVAVLVGVICIVLYRKRIASQRAELECKRSYISGLENERRRLAKELHDGVCNDILAVNLLMDIDGGKAKTQLRNVWRDARDLSHALMPPLFNNTSLLEAVEQYVEVVSKDMSEEVKLSVIGADKWNGLPPNICYELYRIIQEAVSNAIKHGEDNCISVTLDASGGNLIVCVENVLDVEHVSDRHNGIGIETIKMRATSIGATASCGYSNGKYTVEIKLK